MQKTRGVTLAESNASADRVAVVLQVASRGARDPDREVLVLVEQYASAPETVAEQLVANEDPDRDN